MAIGAGLLKEKIPKKRHSDIDKIKNIIKKMRNDARNQEKIENTIIPKKAASNFISILGGRGSGKTSVMYTILRFLEQDKENKNILLPIIDPNRFNAEDQVMGWIIYGFEKEVEKLLSSKENRNYCDGPNINLNKLEASYKKLKEIYTQSRMSFRDASRALAKNSYDYNKMSKEISFADMKLLSEFENFIDRFIEVKRIQTEIEPMIYISFDDADLSPEHCGKILSTILNYLKHSNIIVFILGDYSTFKEAITLDALKREEIMTDFSLSHEISELPLLESRRDRADDILAKVMPVAYRIELENFNVEDRFKFVPYGNERFSEMSEYLRKIQVKELTFLDILKTPKIDFEDLKEEYEKVRKARWTKEQKAEEVSIYKEIEGRIQPYQGFEDDLQEFIKKLDGEESVGVYANILPEYPRRLINLYHVLEEAENLRLEVTKGKMGYKERTEIKNKNFETAAYLYKAFSKFVSTELKEIITLEEDLKKFVFDFKNIEFESKQHFTQDGYNISTELLIMKNTEINKTYSKNQSAFVQLFYDVCKVFLDESNYVIKNDKDLSNVSVFKKEEDKLNLTTLDTETFWQYYVFKEVYKYSIPLIRSDRRTKPYSRMKKFLKSCISGGTIIFGDYEVENWMEENEKIDIWKLDEKIRKQLGSSEECKKSCEYNILEFVMNYSYSVEDVIVDAYRNSGLKLSIKESFMFDERFEVYAKISKIYNLDEKINCIAKMDKNFQTWSLAELKNQCQEYLLNDRYNESEKQMNLKIIRLGIEYLREMTLIHFIYLSSNTENGLKEIIDIIEMIDLETLCSRLKEKILEKYKKIRNGLWLTMEDVEQLYYESRRNYNEKFESILGEENIIRTRIKENKFLLLTNNELIFFDVLSLYLENSRKVTLKERMKSLYDYVESMDDSDSEILKIEENLKKRVAEVIMSREDKYGSEFKKIKNEYLGRYIQIYECRIIFKCITKYHSKVRGFMDGFIMNFLAKYFLKTKIKNRVDQKLLELAAVENGDVSLVEAELKKIEPQIRKFENGEF